MKEIKRRKHRKRSYHGHFDNTRESQDLCPLIVSINGTWKWISQGMQHRMTSFDLEREIDLVVLLKRGYIEGNIDYLNLITTWNPLAMIRGEQDTFNRTILKLWYGSCEWGEKLSTNGVSEVCKDTCHVVSDTTVERCSYELKTLHRTKQETQQHRIESMILHYDCADLRDVFEW